MISISIPTHKCFAIYIDGVSSGSLVAKCDSLFLQKNVIIIMRSETLLVIRKYAIFKKDWIKNVYILP